jgi:hypothetical protein
MPTLEEMIDLKKRYEEAQAAKGSSEIQDLVAGIGSNIANRPTYASIMLNRPSQRMDFSPFKGGAYEKPEDIADLYAKYQEAQKNREGNLEVEKMKEDRRLREREEDYQRSKEKDVANFGQQKALKAMDLAQKEKEKRPTDLVGKLEKLNASDKARFDNIQLGLDAVKGMDEALAKGSNTFSLIGSNQFTSAQDYAAEAFGRMQSGGAINKDEEERFKRMGPGPTDSVEMQAKKLAAQKKVFEDRLKTLGFSADEIGKSFELSYKPKGGKAIPGLAAEANAASGPQVGSIEDGYKFKGGDPKDSKNWEKVK